MANGSINLVDLDFSTLKQSLKEYLSSQTTFKDYDFDGSNMSVLLDVMSYNTYINSFYLNMVASEMFLDTAQLRESVISHAKELNYLPRSFRSARARVNINVTPVDPSVTSVYINRGTSFTSKTGSNTYTFTVPDNIVVTGSVNGTFTAANVEIIEGVFVTDTYVYNNNDDAQRFVLSNPTIDTTTLRLYVVEDNAGAVLTYNQANSYLNVNASSQVFFLQAAESDLYEIVFGNGNQGRVPKHGSIITAVYNVGNGELPNGCAVFSSDDAIDGHANVNVTTASIAEGGAVHETLHSIRRNAPRAFQTQERAVTANDYKTLLQLAYPEISAAHVYGGEDADPPRYGKVMLCLDIRDADGISQNRRDEYASFLRERSPLTIDPVFIDPEFLNLEVYSLVNYNINSTTMSENDLASVVKTRIRLFNELNLGDFNTTFRYSKLVKEIDDADQAIVSNSTEVIAYKDITPTLNENYPFTVRFNNRLKVLNSAYVQPYVSNHSVYSTPFVMDGVPCKLEDDGEGVMRVVTMATDPVTGEHAVVTNVGTVDYMTGTIVINKFNVSSYDGTSVRIKVVTEEKDIVSKLNDIIQLRDQDIFVNVNGVRA